MLDNEAGMDIKWERICHVNCGDGDHGIWQMAQTGMECDEMKHGYKNDRRLISSCSSNRHLRGSV
jgi:hypothetical protein